MSSSKVRKLKRELIIASATWATNVLTVNTATNHYLVNGDTVKIFAGYGPEQLIDVAVTVTDGDTFTVPCTQPKSFLNGRVEVDFWRTGQSGRVIFPLPRSCGANAVVQSYVTGTGGASYDLDLSLDGVHWTTGPTVTHAAVDGDNQSQTIGPMWAYGSCDISSIGAATKLSILYAA